VDYYYYISIASANFDVSSISNKLGKHLYIFLPQFGMNLMVTINHTEIAPKIIVTTYVHASRPIS